MSLVLDASMALMWLLEDEATAKSDDLQRRVETDGAVVPAIWKLEVASGLRTAVRRGRATLDLADQSLQRLTNYAIAVDPYTDHHAWGETWRLSRTHDLTPYDAAYLELAIRTNLPLASADRRLLEAAEHAGIEVLSP